MGLRIGGPGQPDMVAGGQPGGAGPSGYSSRVVAPSFSFTRR